MTVPAPQPLFQRREEAGALLGERAGSTFVTQATLLALSPGGAAVALGMAHSLGTPVDVLGVSPIGFSSDVTEAVGCVVEDGSAVFDPEFRPSFDQLNELETATDWARFRVQQIAAVVRPDRRLISFTGRQVMVVEDILRSPWPPMAALQFVTRHGATRAVVATAVGCLPPLERLQLRGVEVLCLRQVAGDTDPSRCFAEGRAPSLSDVPALLDRADGV